jgi:hypothetical protein
MSGAQQLAQIENNNLHSWQGVKMHLSRDMCLSVPTHGKYGNLQAF